LQCQYFFFRRRDIGNGRVYWCGCYRRRHIFFFFFWRSGGGATIPQGHAQVVDEAFDVVFRQAPFQHGMGRLGETAMAATTSPQIRSTVTRRRTLVQMAMEQASFFGFFLGKWYNVSRCRTSCHSDKAEKAGV
jgi:hypothetical protein